MAGAYVREPDTFGEVVLHTNKFGPLQVAFKEEAPKACRNFVQNCLEGYYDGCLFHRVIKDFMVQTGDPSGTGNTCESIYGEGSYPTEAHGRLQYRTRGMLGVANAGKNTKTNGSQFFITLGPARDLNGVHSLFGKVVGNSLYNLIKLAEVETDPKTDRPLVQDPTDPDDLPKITHTEVTVNPFDDVEIRGDKAQENLLRKFREQEQAKSAVEEALKGGARVGGRGGGASASTSENKEAIAIRKNKAVISIEEDEEDEGSSSAGEREGDERSGGRSTTSRVLGKIKSAHDVLENDARLLKTKAYDAAQVAKQMRAVEKQNQEQIGGASSSRRAEKTRPEEEAQSTSKASKRRRNDEVGEGGVHLGEDSGSEDSDSEAFGALDPREQEKHEFISAAQRERQKRIDELKKGIAKEALGKEGKKQKKQKKAKLMDTLLEGFTKGITRASTRKNEIPGGGAGGSSSRSGGTTATTTSTSSIKTVSSEAMLRAFEDRLKKAKKIAPLESSSGGDPGTDVLLEEEAVACGYDAHVHGRFAREQMKLLLHRLKSLPRREKKDFLAALEADHNSGRKSSSFAGGLRRRFKNLLKSSCKLGVAGFLLAGGFRQAQLHCIEETGAAVGVDGLRNEPAQWADFSAAASNEHDLSVWSHRKGLSLSYASLPDFCELVARTVDLDFGGSDERNDAHPNDDGVPDAGIWSSWWSAAFADDDAFTIPAKNAGGEDLLCSVHQATAAADVNLLAAKQSTKTHNDFQTPQFQTRFQLGGDGGPGKGKEAKMASCRTSTTTSERAGDTLRAAMIPDASDVDGSWPRLSPVFGSWGSPLYATEVHQAFLQLTEWKVFKDPRGEDEAAGGMAASSSDEGTSKSSASNKSPLFGIGHWAHGIIGERLSEILYQGPELEVRGEKAVRETGTTPPLFRENSGTGKGRWVGIHPAAAFQHGSYEIGNVFLWEDRETDKARYSLEATDPAEVLKQKEAAENVEAAVAEADVGAEVDLDVDAGVEARGAPEAAGGKGLLVEDAKPERTAIDELDGGAHQGLLDGSGSTDADPANIRILSEKERKKDERAASEMLESEEEKELRKRFEGMHLEAGRGEGTTPAVERNNVLEEVGDASDRHAQQEHDQEHGGTTQERNKSAAPGPAPSCTEGHVSVRAWYYYDRMWLEYPSSGTPQQLASWASKYERELEMLVPRLTRIVLGSVSTKPPPKLTVGRGTPESARMPQGTNVSATSNTTISTKVVQHGAASLSLDEEEKRAVEIYLQRSSSNRWRSGNSWAELQDLVDQLELVYDVGDDSDRPRDVLENHLRWLAAEALKRVAKKEKVVAEWEREPAREFELLSRPRFRHDFLGDAIFSTVRNLVGETVFESYLNPNEQFALFVEYLLSVHYVSALLRANFYEPLAAFMQFLHPRQRAAPSTMCVPVGTVAIFFRAMFETVTPKDVNLINNDAVVEDGVHFASVADVLRLRGGGQQTAPQTQRHVRNAREKAAEAEGRFVDEVDEVVPAAGVDGEVRNEEDPLVSFHRRVTNQFLRGKLETVFPDYFGHVITDASGSEMQFSPHARVWSKLTLAGAVEGATEVIAEREKFKQAEGDSSGTKGTSRKEAEEILDSDEDPVASVLLSRVFLPWRATDKGSASTPQFPLSDAGFVSKFRYALHLAAIAQQYPKKARVLATGFSEMWQLYHTIAANQMCSAADSVLCKNQQTRFVQYRDAGGRVRTSEQGSSRGTVNPCSVFCRVFQEHENAVHPNTKSGAEVSDLLLQARSQEKTRSKSDDQAGSFPAEQHLQVDKVLLEKGRDEQPERGHRERTEIVPLMSVEVNKNVSARAEPTSRAEAQEQPPVNKHHLQEPPPKKSPPSSITERYSAYFEEVLRSSKKKFKFAERFGSDSAVLDDLTRAIWKRFRRPKEAMQRFLADVRRLAEEKVREEAAEAGARKADGTGGAVDDRDASGLLNNVAGDVAGGGQEHDPDDTSAGGAGPSTAPSQKEKQRQANRAKEQLNHYHPLSSFFEAHQNLYTYYDTVWLKSVLTGSNGWKLVFDTDKLLQPLVHVWRNTKIKTLPGYMSTLCGLPHLEDYPESSATLRAEDVLVRGGTIEKGKGGAVGGGAAVGPWQALKTAREMSTGSTQKPEDALRFYHFLQLLIPDVLETRVENEKIYWTRRKAVLERDLSSHDEAYRRGQQRAPAQGSGNEGASDHHAITPGRLLLKLQALAETNEMLLSLNKRDIRDPALLLQILKASSKMHLWAFVMQGRVGYNYDKIAHEVAMVGPSVAPALAEDVAMLSQLLQFPLWGSSEVARYCYVNNRRDNPGYGVAEGGGNAERVWLPQTEEEILWPKRFLIGGAAAGWDVNSNAEKGVGAKGSAGSEAGAAGSGKGKAGSTTRGGERESAAEDINNPSRKKKKQQRQKTEAKAKQTADADGDAQFGAQKCVRRTYQLATSGILLQCRLPAHGNDVLELVRYINTAIEIYYEHLLSPLGMGLDSLVAGGGHHGRGPSSSSEDTTSTTRPGLQFVRRPGHPPKTPEDSPAKRLDDLRQDTDWRFFNVHLVHHIVRMMRNPLPGQNVFVRKEICLDFGGLDFSGMPGSDAGGPRSRGYGLWCADVGVEAVVEGVYSFEKELTGVTGRQNKQGGNYYAGDTTADTTTKGTTSAAASSNATFLGAAGETLRSFANLHLNPFASVGHRPGGNIKHHEDHKKASNNIEIDGAPTADKPYLVRIPLAAFRPQPLASQIVPFFTRASAEHPSTTPRTDYVAATAGLPPNWGADLARKEAALVSKASVQSSLRLDPATGPKLKRAFQQDAAKRFVWKLLKPVLSQRRLASGRMLANDTTAWANVWRLDRKYYSGGTEGATSSGRKYRKGEGEGEILSERYLTLAVHETMLGKELAPHNFCTADMIWRAAREATNTLFESLKSTSGTDEQMRKAVPAHPEPRIGVAVTSRKRW
eukprot:g7060.t1